MGKDQLLEALTTLTPRGGENDRLVLRRGYVASYDEGPPAVATITVGGVAAGDIQASYPDLPVIGSITEGSIVYWLQTGVGTGLVLGTTGEAVDIWTAAQPTNTQTASYQLVGDDIGKIVFMNVGTANNLTVPSGLGLTAGQKIDIVQLGAGQTTVVQSSTTVNGTPGLKLRARYSAATLICTATNTYVLAGDLAA